MKVLEPWQVGDIITASKLNAPVEAHNDALRRADPPAPVPFAPLSEAAGAVPFIVTGMDKDYLLAKPAGEEGGAEVKIAKPYKLRWKPFDRRPPVNLITYTYSTRADGTAFGMPVRVALGPQTQGFPQETQIVIPRYDVGRDLIFAVKTDVRLGIAVDDDPEVTSPPSDVDWLDINADGRAWAAEAVPVP